MGYFNLPHGPHKSAPSCSLVPNLFKRTLYFPLFWYLFTHTSSVLNPAPLCHQMHVGLQACSHLAQSFAVANLPPLTLMTQQIAVGFDWVDLQAHTPQP